LTVTVRAAVDGGDEFGRQPAEMVPLREPPFYGIPVWPALFNTQGGPRRGAGGEVIGTDGTPIPGLFSAGELGSIWGSCTRARATLPRRWSSAGSLAAAPPPRRSAVTSVRGWS
jgi:predicted oxidoreductase